VPCSVARAPTRNSKPETAKLPSDLRPTPRGSVVGQPTIPVVQMTSSLRKRMAAWGVTAALAVPVALSGCALGSSPAKPTPTARPPTPAPTATAAPTPTTAATINPTNTPTPSAVPSPSPSAPPTPNVDPVVADPAVIRQQGYVPNRSYAAVGDGQGGMLYAWAATCKDSGDGYCQKVFFFDGAKWLGTDTSRPSTAIDAVRGDGTAVIAVQYAHYKSTDPLCCPSLPAVTILYSWNGSTLTPSGTPP